MILELQKFRAGRKGEEAAIHYVESLKCVRVQNPLERVLEWQQTNACLNGNYVVVSYTWAPSVDEDTTTGGYSVRSNHVDCPTACGVRDSVLDRVKKYLEYAGCSLFWIDQVCVDQEDEKAKEDAVHSMHLVYSLSEFPVVLLSVRIESEADMSLLIQLLRGDCVERTDEGYLLGRSVSDNQARTILELLDRITSDTWWSRAWTFHEDYVSSIRMALLIPHCSSLEMQKRDAGTLLGGLDGEINVKSVKFREEATKFCLAYQNAITHESAEFICRKVIEKAGKYNILLRELLGEGEDRVRRAMSSSIFADIAARGISEHSDRPAIAANCCGYPIRLDTNQLKAKKCSSSISMLTLYYLNGEIVRNSKTSNSPLNYNTSGFLKSQSLDSFRPPVKPELTFLKSCRFTDVNEDRGRFGGSPYRGIFIHEDSDENDDEGNEAYMFTAFKARGENWEDMDKYISLQVELDSSRRHGGCTRLIVKRWVNGLCFFHGEPLRTFVFPWPPSLTE
ncbi:MAG: hypothetical protein M1813_000854 [Trichoglossum hirsutum]|nr:MAG: hypothetical protein M1813_000854 [Trichoglossum hirsutum]